MANPFELRDPDFEERVRASFRRLGLMTTIGARLTRVSAGEDEIEAPFGEGLTQQHGYVHAGVVTALVDSACGYSALSLAPPGLEMLTVEYKVNFLAPANMAARSSRSCCRGSTRPALRSWLSGSAREPNRGSSRSPRESRPA